MRTRILITITMVVGEPPLTREDSPLIGSAHQRPKSSISKQVTRPEYLAPPGGLAVVCAGPCGAIGWDDSSQGALHPHQVKKDDNQVRHQLSGIHAPGGKSKVTLIRNKAAMSMYGGLVPMSPGVSSNIQVGSQRRKPGLLRVPSLV
jgi:hypothetical protein